MGAWDHASDTILTLQADASAGCTAIFVRYRVLYLPPSSPPSYCCSAGPVRSTGTGSVLRGVQRHYSRLWTDGIGQDLYDGKCQQPEVTPLRFAAGPCLLIVYRCLMYHCCCVVSSPSSSSEVSPRLACIHDTPTTTSIYNVHTRVVQSTIVC